MGRSLDRIRPWAPALLLLAAVVLLAALAPLGLWDPLETRVAEQARPLASPERGAAAVAAPPLQRWLIHGSLALLGVREVAVRLPGALLGLALLGVLLAVARRRWGSTVALAAGTALLCSPHFLLQAGLALGNMPLMACQGLLLLFLLEWLEPAPAPPAPEERRGLGRGGWLPAAGLAAALATLLAGGLLGLALPASVVVCWWLLDLRAPRRRSAALVLLALLLVGGLGAALAPRGTLLAGLAPDLARLAHPLPEQRSTFEHFAYVIAFGFFPWSLLLPAGLVVLAGQGAGPGHGRQAAERILLLLWIGLGYAWAAVGLRLGGPDSYTALPAAALAVGLLASWQPAPGSGRRLFAVSFVFLLWVLGHGLVLDRGAWLSGLVGASFDYPESLRFTGWFRAGVLCWAGLVLALALQPCGWLQRWRGVLERLPAAARSLLGRIGRLERREAALPGTVLLGLALAALLAGSLVPRLTHSVSERTVLDAWRRAGSPEQAIGTYLVPPELSPFYLGSLRRLASRNEFLALLGSSTPAFAVIPRDRLAEVNDELRNRTQRHLTVLDDRSARLLLVANHLPDGELDRNPIRRVLLDAPPRPAYPVGVKLEGSLELIGADFSRASVPVGGTVEITTYFRVLRPVHRSWKVFLHIETVAHRIDTGGTDHQPAQGVFPTTAWREGDIVKDSFVVKVPFFSPLGTYTVRTGLFIGDDRMKVDGPEKQDGKDRILLGELEVTAL